MKSMRNRKLMKICTWINATVLVWFFAFTPAKSDSLPSAGYEDPNHHAIAGPMGNIRLGPNVGELGYDEYQAAAKAEQQRDYTEMLRLLHVIDQKRSYWGACKLGLVYEHGIGVPVDPAQATFWMQKAASQGCFFAQDYMGSHNLFGINMPRNVVEARKWYRMAAEQGDVLGESQLGWMLVHFDPKNYVEAMTWYKKSADQGYVAAQNNIGYLYEHGLGVTQDLPTALQWYEKSAASGYERANFHVGQFYYEGWGTPADKVRGLKAIQASADAGDPDAQQWLFSHFGSQKKP